MGPTLTTSRTRSLRQHEVAFLLRTSENEVRNLVRRGQDLAEKKHLTPEAIIALGALPVTWAGSRRCVASSHIRVVLSRRGDELMIRALERGTFDIPRADVAMRQAPDPLLFVRWL